MFSNLSWYEVVALLLLALFIFGNRLPQLISDGLRMLRNLRRMAQTATSDLSRELGTDIQLEDLHPRTFVRKHLLSEADQEALLKPLKGVSEDVMSHTRGLEQDVREVGRRADSVAGDVRQAADSGRGRGSAGRSTAGSRGPVAARGGGRGGAGEAALAASGAAPDAAAGVAPAGEAAAEPASQSRYDDAT